MGRTDLIAAAMSLLGANARSPNVPNFLIQPGQRRSFSSSGCSTLTRPNILLREIAAMDDGDLRGETAH